VFAGSSVATGYVVIKDGAEPERFWRTLHEGEGSPGYGWMIVALQASYLSVDHRAAWLVTPERLVSRASSSRARFKAGCRWPQNHWMLAVTY